MVEPIPGCSSSYHPCYASGVIEPRWLSETQLRAWEGFLAVSTVINRRIEQQLKEDAGLSHSQYEVLARLSAAPNGELRMTELAGIGKTSKSGLTYQVGQLEKAGLVRRIAHSEDERGVIARLTPKGRRLLEATAPAHAELVRSVFVDPLTPAQFDGLAEAIDVLRAAGMNVR